MGKDVKQFETGGVVTLVIDDDKMTRALLCRLLGVMGAATVLEAADGLEGLKMAFGDPSPKLIICDLNMTPIDGMAVLGAIRSSMNGEVSAIPVVIFSAMDSVSISKLALTKGANGVIAKPFNPIDLSEYLSNLMYMSGASEKFT